jgi:hypothetical protein
MLQYTRTTLMSAHGISSKNALKLLNTLTVYELNVKHVEIRVEILISDYTYPHTVFSPL